MFKELTTIRGGRNRMFKMKGIRFSLTLRFCLTLGLAIFISGCSSALGLNMEMKSESPASTATTYTEYERGLPANALKFIELPSTRKGSPIVEGDNTYVEEYVTPEEGGELKLNYCFQPSTDNNEICVKSKLNVPPYAVSSDVLISMNLGFESLMADIVFGPHGTVFEKPVTFTYGASGLDLSDLEGDIGLFYHNEETDLWEFIDAEIKIDTKKGEIKVKTDLEHFS